MRRRRAVTIGILLCCLSVVLFCGAGSAEQAPWDCPKCGRTGITRNYCGGCGYPAPWIKLSREEFEKKGNIVKFGHYEQDNNLDNGMEEIEWIVLNVKEGKSLLISKYGLETKSYAGVTWETCTLRDWLNNDFLKTAFTEEEQSSILMTTVDNGKNQGYKGYDTSGGNDTHDKLFLLSYHEAFVLYFKSNEARKCAPTSYAEAHGAYMNNKHMVDGRGAGWWWLRSPGNYQYNAMYVSYSGSHSRDSVEYPTGCVRPALWINLESDIF